MNGHYAEVLDDCSTELGRIKEWVERNKFDSNVKYLISYATIKASGTIELVLKQMLFDSLICSCKAETEVYLTKHIIDASFNAKTGKISRLLDEMNKTWTAAFETSIKGRTEKSDLNSLVELRNQFAHGTPINSSIETIVGYFASGCWVLDELSKIVIKS